MLSLCVYRAHQNSLFKLPENVAYFYIQQQQQQNTSFFQTEIKRGKMI